MEPGEAKRKRTDAATPSKKKKKTGPAGKTICGAW
jgi:hypothetical protein